MIFKGSVPEARRRNDPAAISPLHTEPSGPGWFAAPRISMAEQHNEFDTWVPIVKKAMSQVPRPVGWAVFASLTALAVWLKPDLGLLLGGLVVGNYVLMRMEYWTAGRDKVAVEAGIATGGWGTHKRLAEEREVRQKTSR